MSTGGDDGYQQQQHQAPLTDVSNRQSYHMRPRANVIEDQYETKFFEDAKVRYTIKVCKINGQPRVGFTRFYYVPQLGKYLPATGCYMSVPGWIAFTQQLDLQQSVMTRAKMMQEQCMSHYFQQDYVF